MLVFVSDGPAHRQNRVSVCNSDHTEAASRKGLRKKTRFMPQNVLLLTATIRPPAGVPMLVRTDPAQRIADYCQAVDFYCRIPVRYLSRIIFAENSEADLSPLKEIARKHGASDRIEFLSFNGLDHAPAFGRGYGEFKLLDYAVAHSRILQENPKLRIWKATGRYRILNLKQMIETAPSTFELYCDLRSRPMPWADLRIFACSINGYRTLLQGRYHEFREDILHASPESYLHPILEKLATEHSIVTRFRREPRINGIRGMDSKNYSRGANLIKYWIRASGRYF
jgi:hypothetical protein